MGNSAHAWVAYGIEITRNEDGEITENEDSEIIEDEEAIESMLIDGLALIQSGDLVGEGAIRNFVVVESSIFDADYCAAKPIDPSVDTSWANLISAFINLNELPEQEPTWILGAVYG